MEAREETVDPCELNILFIKCVPHILERIFLSLDYKSFKICLDVSATWRKLLTSELFLEKAKSVFHLKVDRDEEKLWLAAREGNFKEVQRLSGCKLLDINCEKGSHQSSPLCEAAQNASTGIYNDSNHKDVIQLLLERGAKPNKPDKHEWTPLHWAIRNRDNRDILPLLLDGGANLNSVDNNGWTPLHDAAWSSNKDAMQLLLDRGAKPDKVCEHGTTPLHAATSNDCKDMVQLLLNVGAEPNVSDNFGNTLLLLASKGISINNMDIVLMLHNALMAKAAKARDEEVGKLDDEISMLRKRLEQREKQIAEQGRKEAALKAEIEQMKEAKGKQ